VGVCLKILSLCPSLHAFSETNKIFKKKKKERNVKLPTEKHQRATETMRTKFRVKIREKGDLMRSELIFATKKWFCW